MNTVGERENKKSPVFAVHDEELRTHVSGGQAGRRGDSDRPDRGKSKCFGTE